MINSQYRQLYHRFIVNPVAPMMIKFTPSVITLIRCTLGSFSSILYMKGFYLFTMALFMLSNFVNSLDTSVRGFDSKAASKAGMTELICDRFLEVGLFLVYCYLDTNIALYCFWFVSIVMLFITIGSIAACFLKKSSSSKPSGS